MDIDESAKADPYACGVHRWWHLTGPSPEIVKAVEEGYLSPGARVIDLGCGLGSELGWLVDEDLVSQAVGVDLSFVALSQLSRRRPRVTALRADVLHLPFRDSSFHFALDRGCFHYLNLEQRGRYAAETARVLVPGGRLLLRACLSSQGERNDVDAEGVRLSLASWLVQSIEEVHLPSDTRMMPGLVVRAVAP